MSSTGRNLPGREVNVLSAYDTPPGLCRAVVDWLDAEGVLEPGLRVLEPSVGSGNWLPPLQGRGLELEAMDLDPLAPGLDLAFTMGAAVTTPSSANHDPEAEAWARAELTRQGVPSYRQDLAAAGFLVTRPQRRPGLVLGNNPYSVTTPRLVCPECEGSGRVAGARKGSTRKCAACNRWPASKRPKGLPMGWQPERVVQVCDLHVHRGLAVTERHLVLVLRLNFHGGLDRYARLWAGGGLRASRTVVGRPSYTDGGTDSTESAVFWWDKQHTGRTYDGGWLEWTED